MKVRPEDDPDARALLVGGLPAWRATGYCAISLGADTAMRDAIDPAQLTVVCGLGDFEFA